MNVRKMRENDFSKIISLYMNYYNKREEGTWTEETTYKRIHQVWSREDSFCMVLEDGENILGFAIGNFEQYDDLKAYDLIEIVIADACQNQGLGAILMLELERHVKEMGAAMIQLQSVNDSLHNHFYEKLQYKNAGNLIIKSKWL